MREGQLPACPGCGVRVAEGSRFCPTCGTALALTCPDCGFEPPPDAGYCPRCGAALDAAPEALDDASRLESEHRQVTVLFCDIVDSTGIAERVGPEDMHELLGSFFDLAADELRLYGGSINQHLGDGFMALFGVPIAHEDHARRAVLAALGLRRRIGSELSAGRAELIRVRIGVHTGAVVVGAVGADAEAGYTAIGDTMNVAARLEEAADPGTILMSAETERLVAGYVRTDLLGPVDVRGRGAPATVHRVLGRGARRSRLEGMSSRPLGEFVGRERQLATLSDLVEEACDGRGQVVGVVGEPGMGKSRLVLELRRTSAEKAFTVLEGRCLSYGASTPYVPVADIVRANCGVGESDSRPEVESKLALGLAELGLDPGPGTPILLNLLGLGGATEALDELTPEAVKERTFSTLLEMCLVGSRRRPLLLILEDLHWIDPPSQEFLAGLAGALQGARIVLLCTYRPGYDAPWMQHSYATQLALPRLTPREGLVVVRSIVGEGVLESAAGEEMVRRADGNPFFLEELARAMIEDGNGRNLSGGVPDTVQDVLMARIDRLPEEPRRLLQLASVLGREFPLSLLGAIWDGVGDVEANLAELTRLEFIYPASADEGSYLFRHALTQDVAYSTLLSVRKRQLHQAAARAYESLHADRLEDVYDRLAHHYAHTDRSDKAVRYLRLFAESAVRGYAHSAAAEALRTALTHAEQLPPATRDREAVELTLSLVYSLYFLGAFNESLRALRAIESTVTRLDDPLLVGQVYAWLAHTYTHVGDSEGVTRSVERAIAESTKSGDLGTFAKAHYVLAREGFWHGRFDDGAEHGRMAVDSLSRTDEWWWLGHAHAWTGMNLARAGVIDEAIDEATWMKEIGQARDDPRLQSYAAWNIGWYESARGNWERGIAECTESLQRSPDPLNSAYSMGWLGYGYREKGDYEHAVSLLEESIRMLSEFSYTRVVAWFTAWLAEAQLDAGDRNRASDTGGAALDLSRAASEPWAAATAQAALGRIALAGGAVDEARLQLDLALAGFEAIGARLDEARTLLARSELAAQLDDRGGARGDLARAGALLAGIDAPLYRARATELAERLGVAA